MIGASLYIIRCSARNRIRMRLRRLREPRYLVGAIVGALYLYFSFFARFRSRGAGRRRPRAGSDPSAQLAVLAASGPAVGGIALMVVTALAWLLPFDSGLLDFSPAETQFLVAAPVSRRSLLLHRLLRSQLGMLFGAVIVGFTTPSAGGSLRLRVGLGMWLLLCTGKVYFTGISLARARLTAANAHTRRVAWIPLGVMTAALVVVGARLTAILLAAPLAGVRDLLNRVGQVGLGGASAVVLWPFMALTRPLFAAWPGAYLWSLAAASLVLAGSILWVLKIDEAFQDAVEDVAQRKAREKSAAARSYRARASVWKLAPSGRPETALAWKAALQTTRIVDRRSMVRLAAILFALTISAVGFGQRNGLAGALAAFALAGTVFCVLLAPQAIRIDIRQDLQHLELLKTWPVRAASVVRGEMLWPGVLITVLSWTMIAMSTALAGSLLTRVDGPLRLSAGAAAMVLAPSLAFAQLAIQNGAALLFPAWVPLGSQRARGLDAMGQRIIMLGGSWLALLVMLLPGVIAGGIVWFALHGVLGPAALVPGALVCTGALAIEVLIVTELLGPAYERIDLLAVERVE
jgi:hypothetical protein